MPISCYSSAPRAVSSPRPGATLLGQAKRNETLSLEKIGRPSPSMKIGLGEDLPEVSLFLPHIIYIRRMEALPGQGQLPSQGESKTGSLQSALRPMLAHRSR